MRKLWLVLPTAPVAAAAANHAVITSGLLICA